MQNEKDAFIVAIGLKALWKKSKKEVYTFKTAHKQ